MADFFMRVQLVVWGVSSSSVGVTLSCLDAEESVKSDVLLARSHAVTRQKTTQLHRDVHVTDLIAHRLSKPTRGIPVKTQTDARWWPFQEEHLPWEIEQTDVLRCGEPLFAPGRGRCPSRCPFQTPDPVKGCFWRCIKQEDCGKLDPTNSIADVATNMCRPCQKLNCETCTSVAEDTCSKCLNGYELVEGMCVSRMRHVWNVVYAVVCALLLFVVLWYTSLLFRPAKNEAVLQKALRQSDRACLRDQEEGETWYPLTSNLGFLPIVGRAPIGGPGLMLFFSFQHAALLWVTLAAAGWLVLGFKTNMDLFTVGTYTVDDSQQMCQAVRWGAVVREQLRVPKLLFTVGLWAFTSIGVIVYGVIQFRRFMRVDANTSTMMDFALLLTGFPHESGRSVEWDVQAYLEAATRVKPVGVSVCWDYSEDQGQVDRLIRDSVRPLEDELESNSSRYNQNAEGHTQGCCTRACGLCHPCFKAVDALLGMGTVLRPRRLIPRCFSASTGHSDREESELEEIDTDTTKDKIQAVKLLENIKSSGAVVAVFNTESDRDAAMAALDNRNGHLYKEEHVIIPKKYPIEPDSLVWNSFRTKRSGKVKRMCGGVVFIILAIAIWAGMFYAPHAYYQVSTYALSGKPPPFMSKFIFSMMVVLGNQIMYLVCDRVANNVGFHTRDQQQAAYVVLYTGAVLVNTIVDVSILLVSCYFNMKARNVRTDDGLLLQDLPDYTSIFKSQPMMKSFGQMLFDYSFPSCFIIPFVAEAFFLYGLLPHLFRNIVGSRSVSLQGAEYLLKPVTMDLGRYGDILINMSLMAACFMTSSGWALRMMLGLLGGCLFIYVYDRWRVLRRVETFFFASFSTEEVAQKLLALPCATLASAIAFQVHGMGIRVLEGWSVFTLMAAAFLVHLVLHVVAIHVLVPRLAHVDHPRLDTPYSEAAAHVAGSWFSTNPVHCLRSSFLHQQSPPCIYYLKGKEHVLMRNERIGIYYEKR